MAWQKHGNVRSFDKIGHNWKKKTNCFHLIQIQHVKLATSASLGQVLCGLTNVCFTDPKQPTSAPNAPSDRALPSPFDATTLSYIFADAQHMFPGAPSPHQRSGRRWSTGALPQPQRRKRANSSNNISS